MKRVLSRSAAGWLLLGAALVLAVRETLEHTPVPDWIVAPLQRPNTAGAADAIVVLGAGVTDFCTPSNRGIQRVLLASELYAQGRAPMVLFTGGRPSPASCSIAESMARLARRLGVPDERMRVENESQSTWENALRSDAVLRALGAETVLIVTDRPHLPRAEAVFRRFGYDVERAGVPVALGNVSNTDLLLNGLREYAAWGYYWMRGYLRHPPAAAVVDSPARLMIDTHKAQRSDGPLVILGASYAAGWNPSLSRRAVVNKGVGGQQSFEMADRFAADVLPHQPRAVILWGFINDVFRAPREELNEALARVRRSYVAMLEAARGNGIEPIIATEVTIGTRKGVTERLAGLVGGMLGKEGYHGYVNRHVMDVNAWLRELAMREGVIVLDFERVLSSGRQGVRQPVYTAADGSHLTEAAYQALSNYAEPILRERLEGRD